MSVPEAVAAAVALVSCTRPLPAVLLIRRAHRPGDPWSGHWGLPGGRRTGAEPLLDTARRETREEVGLQLPDTATRSLGVRRAGSALGRPLLVAVFHWAIPGPRPVLDCDLREVVEARWLPVDALEAEPERRPLAPAWPDREFPCLPLARTPLWGFTYETLLAWRRSSDTSIAAPPDED